MDNSLNLLMSSTPPGISFSLPGYGFVRNQLRAEHGVSLLITVIDQGKRFLQAPPVRDHRPL